MHYSNYKIAFISILESLIHQEVYANLTSKFVICYTLNTSQKCLYI